MSMRIRSGPLLLACACLACALPLHAGALRLSGGTVDTQQLLRSDTDAAAESAALHLLVQFEPGRAADARVALGRLGVFIEAYVADAAFRVRRNGVSGDALRAIPGVTWVGHWRSDWKLAPALRAAAPGSRFDVYGYVDGERDALLAAIAKIAPAARVLSSGGARLPRATIVLAGDANTLLAALAHDDAVSWITAHAAPEPHNTEASGAIQSGVVGTHPLWARGLTGHGQVVAVADSGLDANERWFTRYDPGSGALVFVTPAQDTLPPAPGSLVSNAKVIANWVQPGATAYETLAPCGTVEAIQHGTHVSGSVAGDSGVTATPLLANADPSDGMAPNVQLLFQDIGADCLVVADYAATLLQARAGGAHIHSNSWGAPTGNSYTGYDFDADDTTWALQDLLLVASAGNRADAIAAIGSPGNAKNALTVGALLHGDSACAASLHTTAGVWGTSIGPGSGWRDKPEISAPGVATISAAGDDFSFGAEEPAESKALSGTSMATPTVAGGAALMRQYFVEGRYPRGSVSAGDRLHLLAPTLKAAVVNSTGEIINSFIGETRLPSYISGWGRMYLDRDLYFPGDSRRQRVFERSHGSGLASGEVHEYAIENVAAGQPLRATLAWFDAASIPGVDYPLVNDLDLEVLGPGGELYRGNAFGDDTSCQTQACYDPCEATLPQRPVNSTISIANVGSRDSRNNLEAIRLLAPSPGRYVFRVRGFSVPGNDRVGSDRQGYGLVVAGAFGLPPVASLPAPQNLAIAQNDSAGIVVAFDSVAAAGSYQLYRAIGSCAATDIADFHLAGIATGASILDPNTIGGDTYAYRVRAIGNDVEGTASACIEAVSNDTCTLPPLFDREAPVADAAAASCRVALSWNPAPARCALSTAVDYTVQRSLTPDFAAFSAFAAASTSYLDTSVANGVPVFLPRACPRFVRQRKPAECDPQRHAGWRRWPGRPRFHRRRRHPHPRRTRSSVAVRDRSGGRRQLRVQDRCQRAGLSAQHLRQRDAARAHRARRRDPALRRALPAGERLGRRGRRDLHRRRRHLVRPSARRWLPRLIRTAPDLRRSTPAATRPRKARSAATTAASSPTPARSPPSPASACASAGASPATPASNCKASTSTPSASTPPAFRSPPTSSSAPASTTTTPPRWA